MVPKGGKGRLLLNHKEEEPGDHVPNIVILELLNIQPEGPVSRRLSLSRVM